MPIPALSDVQRAGTSAFAAGGTAPPWQSFLYGAKGDCNPNSLWDECVMSGSVAVKPTNIGVSNARLCYFRPPAAMTVNKMRFFGVGATTNLYRTAIYSVSGSALTRVSAQLTFSTVANTWGFAGAGMNLTLTANQLYAVAVSAAATGTTAGMLCAGGTTAATTGAILVAPNSWPGNLNPNAGYMSSAFGLAAASGSNGTLDASITSSAAPAWTGGFPAFWLDPNNA